MLVILSICMKWRASKKRKFEYHWFWFRHVKLIWAKSAAIGLDSGLDIAASLAHHISVFTAVTAEGNPKEATCSCKEAKAPEKSRASDLPVQDVWCFLVAVRTVRDVAILSQVGNGRLWLVFDHDNGWRRGHHARAHHGWAHHGRRDESGRREQSWWWDDLVVIGWRLVVHIVFLGRWVISFIIGINL